ncbi:MipA/OmpV family protein [Morganella psychrotolerans]|uniref:MipA/OmpV family protein n=1 Tax=Morganella psychrotolerans TaxID=368603 RepID=UPI0039AF9FDB
MNVYSRLSYIVAAIILGCSHASANELTLGIGTDFSPKYEGSGKYEATPSIEANYSHHSKGYGNIEAGTGGIRWETGNTPGFNMAIQGTYINGRDEEIGYFGKKDDTFAGMGKLKGSAAAGAEINYSFGISKIYLSSLTALRNRTYGGQKINNATTVEMGLNGIYPLNNSWSVGYNLASTWANKDFNQAYFGVTKLQSENTDFDEYAPAAGFKDVSALSILQYKLTDNSSLNFGFGAYHLLGDAAKSPLTEKKYGFLSSVGYTYRF